VAVGGSAMRETQNLRETRERERERERERARERETWSEMSGAQSTGLGSVGGLVAGAPSTFGKWVHSV
jgi:hypothetical protein